jgi:integrase
LDQGAIAVMSYQLYKRPGSPNWNVSWTIDGHRFRKSLGTDDEEVARIRAADKHRKALIGEITGEKDQIDLDHALGRYVMEVARFQTSFQTTVHQAKHLRRIIGKATLLSAIDDRRVADYMARRRGEKVRRGKSPRKGSGSTTVDRLVASATVNREAELLRRVMNRSAKPWGYAVGEVDWQSRLLEESDGNTRWLTHAQVSRILDVSPAHMRAPLICAICTGLRAQNIIRLDWRQVDLQARTITVKMKSRKPGGRELVLPIAQPLLLEMASIGPRDEGRVFLYRGRPIKTDTRHAFLTALRKAGIGAHYTWHDLRHTAASWMRQRKVPIDIVQKILGHTDIKSTMRYAHIGEQSHVQAVAELGAALGAGAAREMVAGDLARASDNNITPLLRRRAA